VAFPYNLCPIYLNKKITEAGCRLVFRGAGTQRLVPDKTNKENEMRLSVSYPVKKKRMVNFIYSYVNLSSMSRNYGMQERNIPFSIAESKATTPEWADTTAADNHGNFIAGNRIISNHQPSGRIEDGIATGPRPTLLVIAQLSVHR
jgi:hypothetical protein